MKGIQVTIDVSESEIIPKAFKRPQCQSSANGTSAVHIFPLGRTLRQQNK